MMSTANTGFNWQIWTAFALSLAAFVSYPFFFAAYPVTRDFPWANLLTFLLAAGFLVAGLRRAFAPARSRWSKISGVLITALCVAVLALFVFTTFILPRDMPAAEGAPRVGQRAPDFALPDIEGNRVALSDLLSRPLNGKAPKGVLLVFYRGHW